MPFEHPIVDRAALRQLYVEPHELVLRKSIDHVDDHARDFIARSPFLALGTSGPDGNDTSPRGGPPGFVAVLDEHRVAVGDLAGNRRLDSFENVLTNPAVALLFLIPGVEETLRVNGRGTLTTDPAVLDACAFEGTVPKVALGVDVAEVFLHCAKAFRRSGLWDPASWPPPEDRPRAGAIFKDHLDLQATGEQIDADLEVGYQVEMWTPGGADHPGS